MRNKQAIEDLAARLDQVLSLLHNDIDSGKPHITAIRSSFDLHRVTKTIP